MLFSSSIVATYGASFGFYLVMTEFFEKGDYLFVEDLTYMRILITGRNFGLKIISSKILFYKCNEKLFTSFMIETPII